MMIIRSTQWNKNKQLDIILNVEVLDAARNMKLNSVNKYRKRNNSYQYRVSDVLFDVLDFLPLFPAQKSVRNKRCTSSSDLDLVVSIYTF